MAGWIKLPRSIRKSRYWPKVRRFTALEALLDLKLSATFEAKTIDVGGTVIRVPKDAVFTSQVRLAEHWRWNRRTVNKFLRSLNDSNSLRIETRRGIDKGYTLLTFRHGIEIEAQEDDEIPLPHENGMHIEIPIERTSSAHIEEQKESIPSVRVGINRLPKSEIPKPDFLGFDRELAEIEPLDYFMFANDVREAALLSRLPVERMVKVTVVKGVFGIGARVVEVHQSNGEIGNPRI